MLHHLCLILAQRLAHAIEQPNRSLDVAVLAYGLEALLSTALSFSCLFLIALITKTVLGLIVFILAFVPLRQVTGGYHAGHHWSCLLATCTIYSLCILIDRLLPVSLAPLYGIATTLFACIIIYRYAPLPHPNKPLSSSQYTRQKRNSRRYALINLGIVPLLSYLLPQLVNFYSSALLATALALIIGTCTAPSIED